MGQYEFISRTNQEAYLKDCPLLLLSTELRRDVDSGSISAVLEFQNLNCQSVTTVHIKILCTDAKNEPLENVEEFVYSELEAKKNKTFGKDIIINLPDRMTGNIKIACMKIVFENGAIWDNCDESYFCPFPEKIPLKSGLSPKLYALLREKLQKEEIKCEEVYVPYETENIRLCPCGTYYLKENAQCPGCRIEYEWWEWCVLKVYPYQSPEQIEKQKRKKRYLIIAAVCAAVFLVACGIGKKMILPMYNYHQGINCIEQGKYDYAKSYFSKAGNYKDSKEQYNMADELMQAKVDYWTGRNAFDVHKFYEASFSFEKAGEYEDASERYKESLLQGVKRDISKNTVNNVTLDALTILEQKGGYKESAYYFGKYYYMSGQYKEAYEKWKQVDEGASIPEFAEEYREVRNRAVFQEATELAANLKVEEAYEKLQTMDTEVEGSEQMKAAIKQALDSGFLGKWQMIESTKGEIKGIIDYIIIGAAYRDGELKFYMGKDHAFEGERPKKLYISSQKVETGEEYYKLENGVLQEVNKGKYQGTLIKEGENIREVKVYEYVYKPYK